MLWSHSSIWYNPSQVQPPFSVHLLWCLGFCFNPSRPICDGQKLWGFMIFHYRVVTSPGTTLLEKTIPLLTEKGYVYGKVLFPTPPLCWDLFWLGLYRLCAFGHNSHKYIHTADVLYQGNVPLRSPTVSPLTIFPSLFGNNLSPGSGCVVHLLP